MRRALLACVLAACSNLAPVEPACGNGIVERGEDCDSGPNCRQCSIDCSTVACPDGYVCGPADQLCHAPGGRFHELSASLAFPALGFGVTDIDHDGYGDVVGLSGTSLTVEQGDAAGRLDRQVSTLVPFLAGAPAVTHLDFDATLDMVIPTVDGLVAYTSPFGVAAPYPFPIDVSSSGQMTGMPEMTIPLAHQYAAMVLAAGSQLKLAIIDGDQHDPGMALFPPVTICAGFAPSDLSPDLVDVYEAGTSTILAASGPTHRLCVIEIASASANVPPFAIREISNALAIQGKPVLARLHAGACPSVVDTSASGQAVEYGASGVLGACDLLGGNRTIAIPAGQGVVGHVPLSPPVAGMGPDALALVGGIYAIPTVASPIPLQIFGSMRPIVAIRALDVDGDGDLDAVASAGTFDDLDVLYRYTDGSGAAGFLAVGLDTVAAPLHLVVGDFDGDGIGDITYTEKIGTGERLMIAFGSRDQVHAPVEVSRYSNVLTTCPLDLANSSDPTGTRVRDLVVLDHPPMEDLVLTILYGSPQRALVPFFDPRPPVPAGTLGFRGAAAGTFGATPRGYQDLMAVESFENNGARSRLWRFEPTAQGAMTVAASDTTSTLGECRGAAGDPPFCVTYASFAPWRAHPTDPADIIIGIDGSPGHDVAAFDPKKIGAGLVINTMSLAAANLIPEPGLSPIQTYVADIDGDGVSDLIVGYNALDGSPAGHVIACTAENLAIACHALDVPDLAGWACIDAMPASVVEHQRFDPLPDRTSEDLAVLCLQPGVAELFHVFHDDAGFHAEPLLALPPTVSTVQLADVTGDGIQDVLAVDRDPSNVVPLLRVYPQCTSREVDSCPPPGPLP